MKYLRVLLALTVLFCGFSGRAKADGIDFRATTGDGPINSCMNAPSTTCFIFDPTATLNILLSSAACPPGVTGPSMNYGCYLANNLTGETITSLDITFTAGGEGQPVMCDANGVGGIPVVFTSVNCQQVGSTYVLDFAGGPGVANGTDFFFFEEGANPGDFMGTATITVSPEPDSLVLFSTGALAGLSALWRRRRLRFGAGRV